MWRWLSSRTVVIGTAAVLVIVCCVLPVAYLLTAPLSTGDVSIALGGLTRASKDFSGIPPDWVLGLRFSPLP